MQKILIIGSVVLIVSLFVVYFGATCEIQRRALYPQPAAPPGEPEMPRGTEVVWLNQDITSLNLTKNQGHRNMHTESG